MISKFNDDNDNGWWRCWGWVGGIGDENDDGDGMDTMISAWISNRTSQSHHYLSILVVIGVGCTTILFVVFGMKTSIFPILELHDFFSYFQCSLYWYWPSQYNENWKYENEPAVVARIATLPMLLQSVQLQLFRDENLQEILLTIGHRISFRFHNF